MYGGRIAYGGKLPTSLGERSTAIYNLAEVPSSGYGPYLGNFFDDLAKIAGKVGTVSGKIAEVTSGESKVAVIPSGYSTITVPIPGQPVGVSIPILPLAIGAGLLLFMVMRKR